MVDCYNLQILLLIGHLFCQLKHILLVHVYIILKRMIIKNKKRQQTYQ